MLKGYRREQKPKNAGLSLLRVDALWACQSHKISKGGRQASEAKASQALFFFQKGVIFYVSQPSDCLTKWFLSKRLGTRTKESNVRASIVVRKTTSATLKYGNSLSFKGERNQGEKRHLYPTQT